MSSLNDVLLSGIDPRWMGRCSGIHSLRHPKKLACLLLEMVVFNRNLLFQGAYFQGQALSFREGSYLSLGDLLGSSSSGREEPCETISSVQFL